MAKIPRFTLPLLVTLLLTHCGDRELSKNKQMSRDGLVKEMEGISERAAAREKSPIATPTLAADAGFYADPTQQPDKPVSGQEDAILTDAPNVPPPITRDHPTKVTVKLEVIEVVKPIAEGVDYTFWTFGGSAIAEFGLDVPGTYILVDHSIFRAFNKGAVGMLKVEGDENLLTYSGKQDDRVYML